MCDSSEIERCPAGEISDISHVSATHHSRVVNRDIRKDPVEVHILLSVSIDQIVKCMTGNCQHRLPVEFRIVQSIQQMNSAGS